MDEDIVTWGTKNQLPDYVIHVLMQQGYGCVTELCQLGEEDLELFRLSDIFDEAQCSALRSALALVPASLLATELEPSVCDFSIDHHGDPSVPASHHAMGQEENVSCGTVGQSDHAFSPSQPVSKEGDEFDFQYDPEEFEYIHASLAAASVIPEVPRERCTPVAAVTDVPREFCTPVGAMADVPREFCAPVGAVSDVPREFCTPVGAVADVPREFCTPVGAWSDDIVIPAGDFELGETVRLLLAGKTGNGKSTTGNTILGQELFNTAPDFGSVTAECERQVAVNRNKRFEIMDTPGLYDTSKTHEEICTIIVQAVAGMHPGPHAILYVIKVGRFTPEEYAAYGRLKALFDETITRHIILLFTFGDQLEREGCTLEDLMRSPTTPDNLREVFEECGHRYVLFNNVAADKGPQVDSLLRQVKMLVDSNGRRPYTCPKYSKIGEGLEEEVNKRMEVFEKKDLQRQKYVQELERQTQDAEIAAELTRKEYEEMETQRQLEIQREERHLRKLEGELQQKLKEQKHHTENQRHETERLQRECKRMKEEQKKIQEKHEKKRRHEEKELEKKYKRFEEERRKMKEEERKRDRARAEEMERLKSGVVQKKEQGFLSKAVDFVANPIKKVFKFFGF